MKRILTAGVMALVLSGTALAQSGVESGGSGPFGGGSGLGGSVGAFLPDPSGLSLGRGMNVGRSMLRNAGRGPMAVAQREVGGALTNAAGAVGTLTTALTGANVGATQAGALATALATFGGAPTLVNLQAAVNAYNDAVRSLPAGTRTLPTAMRAVKIALQKLGQTTKASTT